MDAQTLNEIILKYKSGKSLRELGREYGKDKGTIKKLLIKNSVQIEFRDNGKRKHPLNKDYFKFIDSPEKAYYLGFLFADGYVLKDGICSGITLARTDRVVLEGLSVAVYGSDEPVYDIQKMQTNKIPQSRIHFKSREFQQNLLDKNMVHNKSLILSPPLNLPENLIKYFIHGYFDGDGCFSGRTWQIVSTRPFCEWVADFLIKNKIISNYTIHAIKDKGTCRLTVSRILDVKSLFKFFYDESPLPVFLYRKKTKIKEYLATKIAASPMEKRCGTNE